MSNVLKFKPSAKAKAEFKAKFKASHATPTIKSKDEYAGWAAQYPREASMLMIVIGRWRQSSARSPAALGKWAAWPMQDWAAWSKRSERSVKRHIKVLIAEGLIEKARHRHGGSRVLAFLRPTLLALDMTGLKNGDFARLGEDALSAPKPWKLVQLTAPPKPTEPDEDDDKPMTPEEFAKIMAEDWEPSKASPD